MSNTFDESKNFVPFTVIPLSTRVTSAVTMLRAASTSFAVIDDTGQPQTLLQEEHLTALVGDAEHPLAEVLPKLPPLLIINSGSVIDAEDLKEIALVLQRTQAPGLIVYQDNRVIGVIPRSAIAAALSTMLSAIAALPKRLYGEIGVSARTFICRKCSAPQPRRRPRDGDDIPECPRNWLHGPMEIE